MDQTGAVELRLDGFVPPAMFAARPSESPGCSWKQSDLEVEVVLTQPYQKTYLKDPALAVVTKLERGRWNEHQVCSQGLPQLFLFELVLLQNESDGTALL
jgi:hypothetical protein